MKKYLVEIGWDVDEEGFKKSLGIVNSVAARLTGKAAGIASSFIKAGGAVANVLITLNESLLNVVETTAELDLKTERLARQYWTTEQNARSFSTALKVLGKTKDDLMYMTSEEYKQFIELNKLGRTLEAPKDLDKYLQQVRALNFEVNRLKMIFRYGTRWVTYWISMFTGKDVESFTKKLRNLGDFIIKNIQPITRTIAKFFEIFYRLGKAGIKIFTTLGKVIVFVVDLLDSQIARAVLIIGVLSKVLLASPLTMFIGALVMLLLLIDDYMTWKRGGDSALDWSKFDEAITGLNEQLERLKKNLKPIKEFMDNIWDKYLSKLNPLKELQKIINFIAKDFEVISSALDDINRIIEQIRQGKSIWEILGSESKFGKSASEFVQSDNLITKWINSAAGFDIFGSRSLFGTLGSLFSSSGFFSGGLISGGNTTNSTTTVTNHFNIYGNDSNSIGDEIANRLGKMYPTRLPY